MFANERGHDMNSFTISPTPREISFGVIRTSHTRSSSFSRNSVDLSLSPPSLTRSNSLETSDSTPFTPSSTFSLSAFPSLPKRRRPSGERHQVADIEPIFYCEKELLAAAKEQYPEDYPTDESTTLEVAESHRAKIHWVGYAANAPECIMAPSHEMMGQGCYRISKNASLQQVLDSFSACQGPMGPLIATFAGKDRKVPGHDFTYHELNQALYERSTAATTKKTELHSYTVEKNDEGTEIQRGFPFPPGVPALTRIVPGHVGADWHSPLPQIKEWDFVYNKGCPGTHGTELARIAGPSPRRLRQPPNVSNSSILKNAVENHRSTRVQTQTHVRFAENPQVLQEPSEDSDEDDTPPQDIMVERPVKRDAKPAPKRNFTAARPKVVRTVSTQRVPQQWVPPQRIYQAPTACKLDIAESPKVHDMAARYHPGAMVRIANPDEEDTNDALESCS